MLELPFGVQFQLLSPVGACGDGPGEYHVEIGLVIHVCQVLVGAGVFRSRPRRPTLPSSLFLPND